MKVILAIETSCDETAAAVVDFERNVHSNVVASQVKFHAEFGGVVPEIAARKHVELINFIVEEALQRSDVKIDDIVAIAATQGPGLIGSLLIGMAAAKTYALTWGKPLVLVDHIEAHIWANFIGCAFPALPAVCLVVSGGHTSLYLLDENLELKLLGETIDDAVGEAFDKVAKVLNLPYPGGPEIEKAALLSQNPIAFPKPMISSKDLNFSLSGLKTAVAYYVKERGLDNISVSDVAAGFQNSVGDVLATKLARAVERYAPKSILNAGGVIANKAIRKRIADEACRLGIEVCFPQFEYCTDNAAMIGAIATHLYCTGQRDSFEAEAYSITRTNV